MKKIIILIITLFLVAPAFSQASQEQGIIVYSPESDCFLPQAFTIYKKAVKYVRELNKLYGVDFPTSVGNVGRKNRLYIYGEELREYSERVDHCVRFRYVVVKTSK